MANEYFSRTPSVAGNRRTFTFSCWLKRTKIGTGGANRNDIFTAGNTASVGVGGLHFWFIDDNLRIESDGGSIKVVSDAFYRDTSKAYHLVCRVDTTQSDANNRLRMYVNGSLVSLSTNSQPSQNYQYQINNTTPHYIGVGNDDNVLSYYTGGIMSDAFFVDGQSLDASSFGKTNSNGQWVPKHSEGIKAAVIASGGFGTNGFYLPFGSNIGYDQSGLGNNYSANNFDLNADFANKDTITNTFVNINPLNAVNTTLSEGGTRAVTAGNNSVFWLNHGFTSGKWYWEIKKNSGDMSMEIYPDYISSSTLQTTSTPTFNSNLYYTSEGTGSNRYVLNGTGIAMPTGWGDDIDGDVYSFWLDMDANPPVLYARHNGNASTQATMPLSSEFKNQPMKVGYSVSTTWPSADFIYNTGQGTFVNSNGGAGYSDQNGKGKFQYQPPSGYLALCEDNFVDPSIVPTSHFNTLTYSGNSSTRAFTGLGFKPALVWIKVRNATFQHDIHDSVRGGNQVLHTQSGNAEDTNFAYGYIQSFDSDGFTTVSGSSSSENINGSGYNYVAWCWKGGDSNVSNTNGSLTSTVSANQTGGFSVVGWTSSSSHPQTIGHGLGAVPKFMIVKNRQRNTNWAVYHASLGNTKAMYFQNTSAPTTDTGFWNNTSPTNTVFTTGNGVGYATGGIAENYIAYCWSEVNGYSKFGTYNGNGSSDGPFVHTGFKPALLIVKETNTTTGRNSWFIWDNKRNTYNPVATRLGSDLTDADASNILAFDFLSNGFKIKDNNWGWNESGATYAFAAWAESPFDFANAR